MSLICSFEIIKVVVPEPYIFFWIAASIAEAAAVIPYEAETFFAKGIAAFINGPDNLLNNDPKDPPDWIILEIWALESFKSVDILLLNVFLSFVFVLLSVTIHVVDHLHQTFLNPFSELFLFYLRQQFLVFFSFISVNFTFTLLYSTIYTNYRNFAIPLENSFDCPKMVYSLIFVLSALPTTPWNTTCSIALGLASKAFCLIKSTAISL